MGEAAFIGGRALGRADGPRCQSELESKPSHPPDPPASGFLDRSRLCSASRWVSARDGLKRLRKPLTYSVIRWDRRVLPGRQLRWALSHAASD